MGTLIDAQTISNISNPKLPLFNNGPTCFLNETLIRELYSDFELLACETVTRSYDSGKFLMEYWEIVSRKPLD